VVALLRPAAQAAAPAEAAPQYSEQRVADAKKAVCGAYDRLFQAVSAAGKSQADDPTSKFVVAINVRLATQFAANYLRNVLTENDAAPADLGSSVHKLASAWDEIVLAQISGAESSELSPQFQKLEEAGTAMTQACK
jgi:hypothetical protein